MQTLFEFSLPRGYLDSAGQVHRLGSMRLATAGDEIHSLQHPQVLSNEAYLPVILLSRVITQLGELKEHHPAGHRRFICRRPGLPGRPVYAPERLCQRDSGSDLPTLPAPVSTAGGADR